jgi:two-component system phosphate regulon response regulator PhoB
MAGAKILIIEDEADILDLVEFNLAQAGYKTIKAADGLTGLNLARKERPELIVLDLMLPGLEGKEICRRIRQDPDLKATPIVMLTAKADEIDRIIGFELGADDYLTKPFSVRELVLRVKAVLRRAQERHLDQATVLNRGGLTIDPARHQVLVEGRPVELTATEFKLLHHLAATAGRVQTREALLDKVWGFSFEGYARTVDTHVRRLRQKLGLRRETVETVRGVGYRFKDE